MKCPFCGCADTQVVDSRVSEEGNSIRRRRRCTSCDKRFTTFETAEVRMPQVVKTGGPTPLVDDAINRISQRLLQLGEREVSSRYIGEMVMNELAKLDKVAYVRFASVYKSFQDISEFTDAIEQIQNQG